MKNKINHRFIRFTIATVALLLTLLFTSCHPTAAKAYVFWQVWCFQLHFR
nr:MAG TPA_asm: protein of unknown function (DUF4972) [Caudoviricetes sp.]